MIDSVVPQRGHQPLLVHLEIVRLQVLERHQVDVMARPGKALLLQAYAHLERAEQIPEMIELDAGHSDVGLSRAGLQHGWAH